MLLEVLETASLEDFAGGLARAARLRVCVFDRHGRLVVASPGTNDFALLTRHVLERLPESLAFVPVPAHDPPGTVAFVESRAVWYVLAPVYVDDRREGFVGVGEFRDGPPATDRWPLPERTGGVDQATLQQAWEKLPPLDRRGHAHAVVTARWAARQVADWVRREARLLSATQEVALVGDIAELLTGEQDLQRVLARIVRETARVMDCPFCSMRLYDPRTDELVIKAVHNLPEEYLGKGEVVRAASGVDDEALAGHIVYVEDVATDPRIQYPEQARQQGIVSMLTAGMIYRGNPVGVLRVYTDRRRRFRKAQRDLLRAVAYQAATALVHAQLVAERLRNAETQRQLELAGELQNRMIRTPRPRFVDLETALAFHPTYEVAGDFCDFLQLCDGRPALVIGDVSGKGVPASLLMSSVQGALRVAAECCDQPAEILTRLNRQLCREMLPGRFVTLLLVAVDPARGRLTYSNAGHEPLLILRAGDVLATHDAELVLGVRPGEVYHEHDLPLAGGDLLLLYTDGAVEARTFDDEEYGRDRLRDSLRTYGDPAAGLSVDQVLRNIVWDIRRFVGLAEQSDDLTLAAARVLR